MEAAAAVVEGDMGDATNNSTRLRATLFADSTTFFLRTLLHMSTSRHYPVSRLSLSCCLPGESDPRSHLFMSTFFNPANPQFRRGVLLFSIAASSAVGTNILLTDFGSQEHVFSPLHRAINPRIDALFGVTAEDLKRPPDTAPMSRKTAAGSKSG